MKRKTANDEATPERKRHPAVRLRVRSEADATRSLIEASRFATRVGFSAHDANAVATAVSELARNILKYAGEGDIWLEELEASRRVGIKVTATDKGPGIEDIEAAMRDHFSSSGTLGLGLPGVRRMMDDFDIQSAPGKGTRVSITKWREAPRTSPKTRLARAVERTAQEKRYGEGLAGNLPKASAESKKRGGVDCAFFVRPCRGERVAGDRVILEQRGEQLLLAIVDGLGHGVGAHHIALAAESFLREFWTSDVLATMRRLHGALKDTEGAAAGIAVVDGATGSVRYSAVGNTVLRVFGPRPAHLLSTAGTLGHQIRSPQAQQVQLGNEDVLVMYTDGVKERFALDEYPQLLYQSARTIAKTIVDRFGKAHDDASCIVLRFLR